MKVLYSFTLFSRLKILFGQNLLTEVDIDNETVSASGKIVKSGTVIKPDYSVIRDYAQDLLSVCIEDMQMNKAGETPSEPQNQDWQRGYATALARVLEKIRNPKG